jgi:ParB family chromosome partitioning protein
VPSRSTSLAAPSASEGGAAPAQGAAAAATPTLRPPGLLELEELFSSHLDTRVKVAMGAKRGTVTIEFAGLEDLERIYRLVIDGSLG